MSALAPALTAPHLATWAIAGLATLGVIARPFRLPEAIWAALGAAALVLGGLLPWTAALDAVAEGREVYLFLIGMMLLAEVAREEGLFDHVAARAVRAAGGSAPRLFALVYAVGVAVTALLSNDATAVVLTPAVIAAARAARAEPLPYLFICAFIANAASFVLPISNPANLVVFGRGMPPLLDWLARFGLPSLAAVGSTYAVLRWTQRAPLAAPIAADVPVPPLTPSGRLAGWGIAGAGMVLLACSAVGAELGLPTTLAALATLAAVALRERAFPTTTLRGVSWAVLPLVAGLFVLVEGLRHTGVLAWLAGLLRDATAASEAGAAWGAGLAVALGANLVNNLPAGLLAGAAVEAAGSPALVRGAVLIGIDLGPNLSITGSLATILWLVALRREGLDVGFWQFLRLGAVVTIPALLLAIAALVLAG